MCLWIKVVTVSAKNDAVADGGENMNDADDIAERDLPGIGGFETAEEGGERERDRGYI
jgi:hypothetical protein